MDCDGVLTDGRLYFSEHGEQIKVFHARDGEGIKQWHAAGFRSGIISGRNSKMVDIRAGQLGMEFVRQGCKDKLAVFNEILIAAALAADEAAFIGDDTPDAAVMRVAGIGFAVADAHQDAKAAADHITKLKGGRGAVREVIDQIVASKH